MLGHFDHFHCVRMALCVVAFFSCLVFFRDLWEKSRKRAIFKMKAHFCDLYEKRFFLPIFRFLTNLQLFRLLLFLLFSSGR